MQYRTTLANLCAGSLHLGLVYSAHLRRMGDRKIFCSTELRLLLCLQVLFICVCLAHLRLMSDRKTLCSTKLRLLICLLALFICVCFAHLRLMADRQIHCSTELHLLMYLLACFICVSTLCQVPPVCHCGQLAHLTSRTYSDRPLSGSLLLRARPPPPHDHFYVFSNTAADSCT